MNNQRGFAPIAIILIIVGVLALGGGVWYAKNKISPKQPEVVQQEEQINNETGGDKEKPICAQVITPAKNAATGECKEYPTPCDVPLGWVKVNSCEKPITDETAGWKTYRNEKYGFEVKYPADILKLDENKVSLSHTLKNFHKYSAKDGSDLGLAQDIIIVFEKDISKCNEIEGFLKGISQSFEYKNIKGLKYETGAEGEGVVYHCVKNNENKTIFLIERWFLNEAYSIELSKQNDYISSKEQKNIFNQILSTFKFIP